jgi:hypothetical protein
MAKKEKTITQEFKENAIAKFVALGFTEAELRALGITSDDDN